MTIYVHLRPGNLAGYAYQFEVPKSVDEVRFGQKGYLIWDRKFGIRELPPPPPCDEPIFCGHERSKGGTY